MLFVDGYGSQAAEFYVYGSTSGCTLGQVYTSGAGHISGVRCSWDGSSQIQLDIQTGFAGTLTSTWVGGFVPGVASPTAATVLSGGSKTLTFNGPAGYGLPGTTSSIGGSALTAGTCASNWVGVNGAIAGTPATAAASDGTYQSNFTVSAAVSAANVVYVYVCAITAGTPTAKTYNVRVLQ